MDGREFSRAVLDDERSMDVELARADLIDAGRQLVEDRPEIGAVVLKCTNMVPYAADLRHALGLPIFSIYSFVTWFQAGLIPRVFDSTAGGPAHYLIAPTGKPELHLCPSGADKESGPVSRPS